MEVNGKEIPAGKTGIKSFKCEICPKVYPKISLLLRHKRSHTGERPFKCHICLVTFPRNEQVILHVKRKHEGEDPYMCPTCHQTFALSSDLKSHKKTHTSDRIHQCEICKQLFRTNHDLVVHTRKHTGERPFKCDVCSMTFARQHCLVRHKAIHAENKVHKCNICPKSFARSDNLAVHKRSHSGERPFTCDICGKSFIDSAYLITHKRTHTREKPYSCDICQKPFAYKKMLHVHTRSQHTGERPFQCDICDRAFYRRQTMTRHMKIHTGEKKYQCDSCGKQFSRSTGLKSHKPINSHGKHYECDICFESFARRGCLQHHKKQHTEDNLHNGNGSTFHKNAQLHCDQSVNEDEGDESQFECIMCDMYFPSQSTLQHHQRIDCKNNECQQLVSEAEKLKSLSRTDTTSTKELPEFYSSDMPLPYKCEECHKMFVSFENLGTHKCGAGILHNGSTFHKNPQLHAEHESVNADGSHFECIMCDMHFSSKSTLQHHQRTDCKINKCQQLISEAQLLSGTDTTSAEELPEFSSCDTPLSYTGKCEGCHKTFDSLENLGNHNCTGVKREPYSCDCGQNAHTSSCEAFTCGFTDRAYNETVPDVGFICYHCSAMFDTPTVLENHFAVVHYNNFD